LRAGDEEVRVEQVALSGAAVALVTPLTSDLEVDADDVRSLVGRAIDDGAGGVLVAGSTGEGTLLEPEQREQLTALARDAIDRRDGRDSTHRATLLAGASGPTIATLEADVERLAAAGADAILVLAPHTYPLTPEELRDLHLGVADRATVPTLAYHIPQLTGSSLTPATVKELAAHPGIIGMKDSSPDAERRARFVAVTEDVPGFGVVTGHAPTLWRALQDGADGSITAIANVRQRQVVGLHQAATDGENQRAAELQRRVTVTAEGLAAVGTSMPAALKAALQLDGVIRERWCRPPLGSVSPARLDHVRSALLR
jgi:4-hydroxy-tetrahydrodipicolinate synthase